MLDLPPELWIATLDKLRRPSPSWTNAFPDPCDIPTLKALILTSHFFHSLAEPFLYERFRIQGRRDELLAKVDRRTRHPLWVKYVIMVNCGTKVTRYLFSIFPQLRALRGVSLRSVTIEARWNTEILLLPVLEIWESDAIQIKGDLQASMIVPENLRLKHVGLGMKYISVKEAEALARLALSDQLESLKLIRDESAVLRTLNAEAGFSSFHQLRSFEGVIPPDFDLLYNFLRHCPEITSVHITKEIEKRVTLPPAPPDILPRLQSFKGPPRAARLFIQSRPIEHIALLLDMQQRPEDAVFNSLNTASAPIKSLYLATWYMISKTTLASLAAAFPALESLVIDFMVDMEPVRIHIQLHQQGRAADLLTSI